MAANRIVGGLSVDGVMGSHTLSALATAGEDEVLPVMLIERMHLYKSLVDKNHLKYAQFYAGWINRVLMLDRLIENIERR
jgi:lysozyme family protein